MASRGKPLLKALVLCGIAAAIFLAAPLLAPRFHPVLVFVVLVAIALPMLVLIQRAWTRFLWARKVDAARARVTGAAADDPEPHVELGVLLTLTGDEASARRAFERAREIRPRHAQATVGLAHLAAESDDLEGALALFQEAAETDPQLFAAHYGIGGVQLRREQYARAVHAYEKALAIEPDDAFTLAELSRCHLLLGDPTKAEDYFLRAANNGLRDPDLERAIREARSNA